MNHLVDSFGRVHTDLRVSVTDRCNFRCTYCMPAGVVTFKPREELLSFEEIVGIVSVAASLGVRTVRLTGGEPLVRKEIHRLVGMLVNVEGIDEVTLTTNGLLLEEQASDLFHAGLSRLNVSLDSLDEKTFESLARFNGLQKVLRGIATAQKIGFQTIRINAVSIANLTER
ncbi:MAG: radical SAM protein, partial [Planctomycetota bacterium]